MFRPQVGFTRLAAHKTPNSGKPEFECGHRFADKNMRNAIFNQTGERFMRRGLPAVVAAIACVSLCSAAQAQDKVKLRYGQIANSARSVSSLALVTAQRKGFLAKEGIELEIVGLRGVQYQIEELDKGTVDVSHTATPYLIQLALQGSPAV